MALNFPDSPGIGSVFTDTNSGFSYKWDGTVWNGFVGQTPSEIKVLTDISGSFDGSETTFALASDGSSVVPVNAQQLRVVLGGIVQAAGVDYTVSTSNIVFTTAPVAGLDCAITQLGTALSLTTPSDGSITPAKISTGGPSWDSSGNLYVTGVTSTGSLLVSGIATANNGLVVGVGLTLGDNVKLNLGASDDLQLFHDGSNSIIDDAGTGSLFLRSDTEIKFLKKTGSENILVGTPDGSVAAFYDNTKRLETTTGGALIYGTVGAGQTALVVEGDGKFTGVVTATSFSGAIGDVTGISALKDTGDVTRVQATLNGAVVTGVCTATDFSGASGAAADFPNGLTGTTGAFTGNVSGATGTFTGNVTIGGTLTYEDVTNIDSVGFVTARSGVRVTNGGIIVTAGISTFGANVLPDGNGTRDLGATGTRWANLYTSDIDLSNEAKGGNEVDGTWGSYTIQEGENDLFLINRRNGKKYKFVLQEVS